MENDDKNFESYLREFAPQRPRALEQPASPQRFWPRRLAAAAAIAIGMETLLLSTHMKRDGRALLLVQEKSAQLPDKWRRSELLLLPMTRLALNDPQRLDAKLTEVSNAILPDFRKSNSTLQVLARE